MNRVLMTLISLGFALFLRKAMATPDPHETGAVNHAQLGVARYLSHRLAGGQISEDVVGVVFGVMLLFAGVMGFLLHFVVKERGFGPYLNGIICFFGACGVDAAFVTLAPRALVTLSALVMMSSLGAIAALVLFALIKAALLARFDEVVSGARPLGAPQRRGGVPASRMNAATRRF